LAVNPRIGRTGQGHQHWEGGRQGAELRQGGKRKSHTIGSGQHLGRLEHVGRRTFSKPVYNEKPSFANKGDLVPITENEEISHFAPSFVWLEKRPIPSWGGALIPTTEGARRGVYFQREGVTRIENEKGDTGWTRFLSG